MVLKKKAIVFILFAAVILFFGAVAGGFSHVARAESDTAIKTVEAKTDKSLAEPDVIISFGEGWEHEYAVSARLGDVDYYSTYKGAYWMQFDSPILKVYEVTVTDEDARKEIININDKVVITLRVPDNLIGQKFDIRRCNYTFQKLAEKMDYTLSADGKYASFSTDEMRPFMIVCDGESFLIPIIVALVVVVAEGVLLVLQIRGKIKKRKAERAEKARKAEENKKDQIAALAVAPLMLTFYTPSHMLIFVILCVAFVALTVLNIIFFTIGRKIPDDEPQEETAAKDGEESEEESPKAETEEKEPEKPEDAPKKEPEKEPEQEKNEVLEQAKEEVETVVVPVEEKTVTNKSVAPENTEAKEEKAGKEEVKMSNNRSFIVKLIQSSNGTKREYTDIKNKLLSICGTESRISFSGDVISTDEMKLAEIRIKDGALYCIFALGENGKMLKSDVDTGIRALCGKYGLKTGEVRRDDYYVPYLSDEELLKRGLIK